MKKFILVIILCFIAGAGYGLNIKAPLKAETSPTVYIEHTSINEQNNNVVSSIYTNDVTKTEDLKNNGYTFNNDQNIYTKTSTLDEYNNQNKTLKISTQNLNNTINEIFNMQQAMFEKINNLFNNFNKVGNLKNTPQDLTENKENVTQNNETNNQENIQNNEQEEQQPLNTNQIDKKM